MGGSLQEATKPNPYVYAGDDPVNAVDPSGNISVEPTGVFPFNGVAVTFSVRELGFYSNTIVSIALVFAVSYLLNLLPLPIPDEVSSYVTQGLAASISEAQARCGKQGQGATIDFTYYDAVMGGSPSVSCV